MNDNMVTELKKIILCDIKHSNYRSNNMLRHVLQCKYESIFGWELVKNLLGEIFDEINADLDDPKYSLCNILIWMEGY